MGVQLGEGSPNLSGAVAHLCIGRSDFELGAFRQKEPDAELSADDPCSGSRLVKEMHELKR
jgi:hypothetical protein